MRVCGCVCLLTHIYVYLCACLCIFSCLILFVCVFVCKFSHIYMHMCVYFYIFVCVNMLCMNLYMRVFMCVLSVQRVYYYCKPLNETLCLSPDYTLAHPPQHNCSHSTKCSGGSATTTVSACRREQGAYCVGIPVS